MKITVRQRQIIHLIAQGASYQEVADTLSLTRSTIAVHLNRLYRRLGVRSKTEAFHALGFVTLDSKPATEAPCPGGEPAAALEILLDAIEALESDSLTLQQISRALKARAKVFDARTSGDGSPALLGDV
jgi:DNA-binding CsgD family transcriptional regulator